MNEPFSVLLPVYKGDNPQFLRRSIRSVTVEQTRLPAQLVIVVDGPITLDLEQEIKAAQAGSVPVTVTRLPENKGLAAALTKGLTACDYDFVARQDADDISLPNRFELQIRQLELGYEFVGAAIAEFTVESDPGAIRVQPQTKEQIRQVLGWRDPFNHPAVAFSKTKVEECGGYQHLDLMEDYWLFARMVNAGVNCLNLPEVLVLYRVGAGAYHRRGGIRLLRSELKLQRNLRKAHIITFPMEVRNILIRGGYRFVPTSVRRALYRGALKLRRG